MPVASAASGRLGVRRRPSIRRVHLALLALAVTTTIGAGLDAGLRLSGALFTAQTPLGENTFEAIHVFPGTRTTPAFSVVDASSGSATDASAPLAFAGDGLALTSKAWATAFAAERYLEVDLNAPLPAGIGTSGVAFQIDVAAGAAGQTACLYLEVRRASTGSVLGTFGDPASPIACATGTAMQPVSTPISGAVLSTDVANDLRVRAYMRNSAGGTVSIDRAVVSGTTPYAAFTLYAVKSTDAADGTPAHARWPLGGS